MKDAGIVMFFLPDPFPLRQGCPWVLVIVICASLLSATDRVASRDMDAVFLALNSSTAPGGAVLVAKDGQVVFERGYGLTDLRSLRKIDATTNFRLASVTKQFTATAVTLLVQDGKLRYTDRLTDIFSDFPAYGNLITVRNLLNHSSGLLDYEDLLAAQYKSVPEDQIPQIKDALVLELLKKQTTTKFSPGTKWDYSNSGYAVLAMIVEKISGEPFGKFLDDRVFSPLGMRNTIAYENGKNEVSNRAYGHTKVAGVWQETDQSPTSAVLGDGGIYSSIDDLLRWNRELDRRTLWNESTTRMALTPVDLPNNRDPGTPLVQYGFGWFLDPYKDHARMYHNGETIGFRNTIQRFVKEKLTIIVLSNRADTHAEGLAHRVADLYLK
jgi:CubicO group peptidase (beta-lactamase class C family)